jgi:single-strand DNA-binding protein
MAAINGFYIVGNLTKDVELRFTPGGTPTTTYTVAVNNVWYSDGGVKHEECDFVPVTTYGKQAEADAKYLKKGTAVAVTGRIRSWYKKQENKGGFNFEATAVQYLGKPGGSSEHHTNDQTPPDATPGYNDFVRDYEAHEH